VHDQAVELVVKDHIQSEKLGTVCQVLGQSPGGEKLLRTIEEKSPHKDVQGMAAYTLAELTKNKSVSEAEKQFEAVVAKYGDVKSGRGSQTLGEMAKRELFEIQHLGIGKPAPDIEGEDIDGKKFKLSDYRGKVVMLDFWGHW